MPAAEPPRPPDIPDLPPPLEWDHDIDDVTADGLDMKRTGTGAERAALAQAFDILGIESLQVSYRLRRAPADGFRLRGKMIADVVQACVVTLAPVLTTVQVPLSVEFRSAEEVMAADGGAIDLESDTEIEPIENKRLNVGRIAFEELAAALPAYPRRAGAEFTPPTDTAPARENPFAVLAKLKEQK